MEAVDEVAVIANLCGFMELVIGVIQVKALYNRDIKRGFN